MKTSLCFVLFIVGGMMYATSCKKESAIDPKMNALGLKNDSLPGDTIPHDTIPHDTIPHDTIPHDTIPHDTIPHDTIPFPPHDTVPFPPYDTTRPPYDTTRLHIGLAGDPIWAR